MKKIFILLLNLCAIAPLSAQEAFIIRGSIQNLPDSTKLTLFEYQGNVGRSVADTYIIEGLFEFNLPLSESKKMSISGKSDNVSGMSLRLWAEPGITIRITGENNLIFTWKVDSPVPVQAEADRYRLAVRAERVELQKISEESRALHKKLATAEPEDEKQRITERIKTLDAKADSLGGVLFAKELKILADSDPTDFFMERLAGSALSTLYYEKHAPFKDQVIPIYECLPEERKLSETGQRIRAALYPPEKIVIGGSMADAELLDPDGKRHKLSDYTGKGKYIVLEFWGTGCGACMAAMPKVKEMAEQYREQLEVISMNLDDPDLWKKTTEKLDIPGLNLNVPAGFGSELAIQYGVKGVPYFIFISPEGVVLDEMLGANGFKTVFEGLIPQK